VKERSIRTRVVAGSLLWIVGLLLIAFFIAVSIVSKHPHLIAVVHSYLIWATAAIFLVAGFLQMRLGLSPLTRLRATLTDVREGRKSRLDGKYPTEIQALADDLNKLLNERDARVSRAQSQAGDLAHALKTPLAVLSSEMDHIAAGSAGHGNVPAGEDNVAAARQQIDRMRRQMDWHLARARAAASGPSAGLRASVRDSADGIARTVQRLHADRRIAIDVDMPVDVFTRAERPDLDEILGNLIDNACKYARTRVLVGATASDGVVTITVDDDGPGLDPGMRAAVLQRGVRADEAPGGSGFGLAIVRDLAELYGGNVVLDASPLSGLRVVVTLTAA
jgi:signal transduction histidine kinase